MVLLCYASAHCATRVMKHHLYCNVCGVVKKRRKKEEEDVLLRLFSQHYTLLGMQCDITWHAVCYMYYEALFVL